MKRRRLLRFETEISWFALAGALDVAMTFLLLRFSSQGISRSLIIEGNPFARWILQQYGMRGLVVFKVLMIVLVVAIAEFVGRRHPHVARTLLWGGTLVVTAVVVYSMRLLANHV